MTALVINSIVSERIDIAPIDNLHADASLQGARGRLMPRALRSHCSVPTEGHRKAQRNVI